MAQIDLRLFAGLLGVIVHDLNQDTEREHMSVEVKGLAESIRKAKAAIGKASTASARMQTSADRLTDTLAQVEDMTNQLDAAHAELQGAVGTLSNGGPPLDDTSSGQQVVIGMDFGTEPAAVVKPLTPDGAIAQVVAANK